MVKITNDEKLNAALLIPHKRLFIKSKIKKMCKGEKERLGEKLKNNV